MFDGTPPGGAEVGQTPGSRASYPRSSERADAEQAVPEVVLVEFASHGTGLAVVDVEDIDDFFATEPGIKLEWPTFHDGIERWRLVPPPGRPAEDLELPFYFVWRATKPPSVEVRCKLDHQRRRRPTVSTSGAMQPGPPADRRRS